MKVLMISTDRNIFKNGTDVSRRLARYGTITEELHIIVLSKQSMGFSTIKLADNVYAYPTNSLGRISYAVGAMTIGKRICREKGINLISTQDPFETGWLGFHLADKFGLPLQVQVHTDLLSPHFATSFLNIMRVRLAKLLLPRATCIRVVSERIKSSLISELAITTDKIQVLPIYVDDRDFERCLAADADKPYPNVLLTVGRLEAEKQILFAIESFAALAPRFPDWGLVVVGSGSEERKLIAERDRLGLRERIKFTGWQPDTTPYYCRADIYIHTARYEGYGMSLFEAALAGLPIVSTDVGIAPEIIIDGQNGFLSPVGDQKTFVANLRRAMTDSRELRQGALDRRPTLPKVKSEAEYLERYKQCLKACL